jgi:hypothetical protein
VSEDALAVADRILAAVNAAFRTPSRKEIAGIVTSALETSQQDVVALEKLIAAYVGSGLDGGEDTRLGEDKASLIMQEITSSFHLSRKPQLSPEQTE